MKEATEAMTAFGLSMRRARDRFAEAESTLTIREPAPEPPLLPVDRNRRFTGAEIKTIDASIERMSGPQTNYHWQKVGVDRYRYVASPMSGLDPDQRPHPGPVVRAGDRYADWRQRMVREAGRFPDGVTDEQMANARRPAERPPASNRHDDMQDAIVAALRSVGVMEAPIVRRPPAPSLRRSPPFGDYDPNTDTIGNGVTHEQLLNATSDAERYELLWRAGLVEGPGYHSIPPHAKPVGASVVPDDPRKRRLRVRSST